MLEYPILVSKHFLIVEDDPNFSDQLYSNLTELGCCVSLVSNVKDAECIIDNYERQFDIAILDLYIPEAQGQSFDRVMRGEELAYTIRKRSPHTKIIGVSINLEREPFTKFSDLFSGFIYKGDLPHGQKPIILYETIDAILTTPNKKKPKIFDLCHQKNTLKFIDINIIEIYNIFSHNPRVFGIIFAL